MRNTPLLAVVTAAVAVVEQDCTVESSAAVAAALVLAHSAVDTAHVHRSRVRFAMSRLRVSLDRACYDLEGRAHAIEGVPSQLSTLHARASAYRVDNAHNISDRGTSNSAQRPSAMMSFSCHWSLSYACASYNVSL